MRFFEASMGRLFDKISKSNPSGWDGKPLTSDHAEYVYSEFAIALAKEISAPAYSYDTEICKFATTILGKMYRAISEDPGINIAEEARIMSLSELFSEAGSTKNHKEDPPIIFVYLGKEVARILDGRALTPIPAKPSEDTLREVYRVISEAN